VSRDERESGLRMILNFGHTTGHALEAITRYRRFLHGEAVGWGMIAAARLAVRLGMLAQADGKRIEKMARRVKTLPVLPRLAAGKLLERMRADKKARGGSIRMILPVAIGRVRAVDHAPEDEFAAVWATLQREAR